MIHLLLWFGSLEKKGREIAAAARGSAPFKTLQHT